MDDLNRFSAIYTDELRLNHEEATRPRRTGRTGRTGRRTTRNAIAGRLHRLADQLDGE